MKKVILVAPHWANGVKHEAGEEIELSDADYQWLMSATLEARSAQHRLAEETQGHPLWIEKYVKNKNLINPAELDAKPKKKGKAE